VVGKRLLAKLVWKRLLAKLVCDRLQAGIAGLVVGNTCFVGLP